jgi:hypothetical protein
MAWMACLWLKHRDYACGTEALPGQPLNQRGQLFIGQTQLIAAPGFAPVEFTPIQSAGTEPDTETIVDQYFHSVASFVGEQVSAMGRF